jgi:hypothetical protein
MAHFDGIDVNDPNFPYGSLPEEFVRRRLLPIHPNKQFNKKLCITGKTRTNLLPTIADTYLILIPVTWNTSFRLEKFVPELFDDEDLTYIHSLISNILVEENQHNEPKIFVIISSHPTTIMIMRHYQSQDIPSRTTMSFHHHHPHFKKTTL